MAIKERKMRRESAAVSSSSNSGKNNDTQTNNSNNSTSSMWMDWIEKSVDLLCEDSCSNASKGVIREALRIPQTCPQPDLHAVDYAALHDEFLESLLFEQAQNHSKRQQQQQQLYDDSSAATSLILDEASQSTFSCSTNNSVSLLDEDETTSSRKRRRPIRLHRRRTPPSHRRKTRVAALFENRSESNISEQLQLGSNSSFSSSVSFMNLSKTDYDHPSHYLHPQCRMQKDKGRGEAVGANICAKGRDACLLKLRAKMHLLTEYAAGSSTSSNSADRNSNSTIGGGGSSSSSSKGTMKRRKAIVAAHYDNFIETRSLIELRMGFLSLQYGVLLRWDTGRTGKVTLVVLRKMCHDSFYHGILKKQQHLQQQQQRRMFAQRPDSGHVVDANNAIFSRPDGMEVTLLEPPFQVSRPDEFAPSMLRVSVLEVVGVSRKTNWMMQVSYDAVSENIPLTYNMDRSCFLPKTKRPLKKVISEQEAIASVDIKLYELCSRRHRRRPRLDALHQHRLVHSVRIPLADYVQPQPSSSNSNHNPPVPTTRVRIPFPNNNNNNQQDDNAASIYVELLFQSDYACWLMQELEARRRRQERKTSDFFSSFMEEENESPWEWMLCCFC